MPFNGYQANVDTETLLRNTINPLQSSAQSKFIPDSNGDLYNNSYLPYNRRNKLFFKRENFNMFNPNTHNIGKKMFYNHTKTQIRNL